MTTETKFTVGEYKTRDGRDAIVCAVNRDERLIGAYRNKDGDWTPSDWYEKGQWVLNGPSAEDLMPPLREWWICTTGTGSYFTFFEKPSRENEWDEIIHVREVRDDQA